MNTTLWARRLNTWLAFAAMVWVLVAYWHDPITAIAPAIIFHAIAID